MADFDKAVRNDRKNPLYRAWIQMKGRCYNKNLPDYKRWGGRGITVCDRWQDYDCFLEDMGDGYSPELSLDRIDNDKGYSPDNCKWSTKEEQCNNRRSNKFFTINGITQTFAQWIKQSGVKSSTARQRFYVYNWSIEQALEMEAEIG